MLERNYKIALTNYNHLVSIYFILICIYIKIMLIWMLTAKKLYIKDYYMVQ